MTKDHDITSLLGKATVFKIVNLNCTKHNLSYVIITNPIVEHVCLQEQVVEQDQI